MNVFHVCMLCREPTSGGALFAENSTVRIARSKFVGNKITGFRGAAGGALYFVDCNAFLEVRKGPFQFVHLSDFGLMETFAG